MKILNQTRADRGHRGPPIEDIGVSPRCCAGARAAKVRRGSHSPLSLADPGR